MQIGAWSLSSMVADCQGRRRRIKEEEDEEQRLEEEERVGAREEHL